MSIYLEVSIYSIRGLIGLVAAAVGRLIYASLHVPRIVANLIAILQCGKQAFRAAAHEMATLRLHVVVDAHRGGAAQAIGDGFDQAQITCKNEAD